MTLVLKLCGCCVLMIGIGGWYLVVMVGEFAVVLLDVTGLGIVMFIRYCGV